MFHSADVLIQSDKQIMYKVQQKSKDQKCIVSQYFGGQIQNGLHAPCKVITSQLPGTVNKKELDVIITSQ